MDREGANLRLTVWPTVVSLLLHAAMGYVGLKIVPSDAALPSLGAGDAWRADSGAMTWLETVPPPPPETIPPTAPPVPAVEPVPPEKREIRVGEASGNPESDSILSSPQEEEHAAKLSRVEQPALTNQPGGGGGGGGGGGTVAGSGKPASTAPTAPSAPRAPSESPPERPREAAPPDPVPTRPGPVPDPALPKLPPELQPKPAPSEPPPREPAPSESTKVIEPPPAVGTPDEPSRTEGKLGLPVPAPAPAAPTATGSGIDAKPIPEGTSPSPAPEHDTPVITSREGDRLPTGQSERSPGEAARPADDLPEGAPRRGEEGEDLRAVIEDLLRTPRAETGPAPTAPALAIPIPSVTPPVIPFAPSVISSPPAATSPAPAAPPPAGAPGTRPAEPGSGLTGDPRLDDIAWLSEKVSDATSKRRSAQYRDGRVTAGDGIELVVTRRPESTTFTRLRGAQRNPTFDIVFTRSGVVKDVIRVRTSGNGALDEDISNAIHFWRARGPELAELGDRADATLTVRLTVLLLSD